MTLIQQFSAASTEDARVLPDLNSPRAIGRLVRLFYARLLEDPLMAPVFLEVAGVDLEEHLPRIEAYWRKMLLGEQSGYDRNMIRQHQRVHAIRPLEPPYFERWGSHFRAVVTENFAGPGADRALRLTERILFNLERFLNRG
ncbi:MAG: globin [Gammaproteobacteria bacterium HGW-Gammaproteobacteria-8]|nr:MAG: globin [Gammaproteobacteria bacterium HGW-Gammaproteobacteria-8]